MCLLFAALLIASCSYTKNLSVLNRMQAKHDLDYLVKKVETRHPDPFRHISEKDFDAHIQKIEANLTEEINRKNFSLLIAELLALIRDDHTRNVHFPDFIAFCRFGGKIFPLRLRYEDGGMTVINWRETFEPVYLKKGDKIISINEKPMKSLLRQYRKYVSAKTELQQNWMLEGRLHQFLWLTEGENESFELALVNSSGKEYTEIIPATIADGKNNTRTQEYFSFDFYFDKEVCLFKAQSFWIGFLNKYMKSLKSLISQMKRNKTSVLIVDLRGNGGGHWKFTWGLLKRTIKNTINAGGDVITPISNSWDGNLVLLCDRWTASAAVYTAVIVKDCGVGTITGEETGGRASYFGNIENVLLPNSGLTCQVATRYFIRPGGFDDGRGVLPDLPLDVTLEDSVLVEKIYEYIKMNE